MPQEKSLDQRHEDQRVLRQAALLWQTQKLYEKAHQASTRTKAYENGDAFKFSVMAVLERAEQELDKLQNLVASGASGGCISNDDCPDDYICADGVCQSPFTGQRLISRGQS